MWGEGSGADPRDLNTQGEGRQKPANTSEKGQMCRRKTGLGCYHGVPRGPLGWQFSEEL